ncbi:MAG: zinc-ribbon domain-containing protein, partial [Candidatus Fimenecus sp.]|nr:zinc-ribbon domain-containing protein [Candidatus Fimenecus sp.]
EGMGNMGGSGGSAMGDVMGLGIGLQAAQAMSGQIGNMFGTFNNQQSLLKCAKCGADIPQGSKFCLQCGEKVAAGSNDAVVCPECGKTVAKGKYCLECGHKFVTTCPNCGKEIPEGAKFCLECGTKI